jgi:Zn-dependent M28 family amino/carboxypeptidase
MECDIEQLWRHVEFLAAEPRFAETARLEVCRQYCERRLALSGWTSERRSFTAVSSAGEDRKGSNIVARRGLENENFRRKFILGAHVDSCEDTPGADDNASAVAVMLEVARVANETFSAAEFEQMQVELELVAFDLEEHGMLGGAFHAATCRKESQNICGMVSLEMLGFCSHAPGSQILPPELAGMYPDVGDFIAVVGNQNSTALIQHFKTAFDSVKDLPSQSLQVPDDGRPLPPSRLSDHSPFWDEGFAALMITDTSFMRNPHYHMSSDRPDTLDRAFLHKVANGVWKGVESLLRNGLA